MRPLGIEGAWVLDPVIHTDHRGQFHEWFQGERFQQSTGHQLPLAQANIAVSRRGALRGIHFAEIPPGQAKYSACVRGAGLEVIVDIRTGSPTFGRWEAVPVDDRRHTAVYVSAGLGRAFLSLTDHTTLMYLCSSGYNPGREHAINPLDPDLAIDWPTDIEPLLSDKDAGAPGLAEAERLGLLPSYRAWQEHHAPPRGA
ncbi:dTDP-4-dehydrorhamnose 3,5-epimerase family protein [Streptomyces sp. UNOB3_S3]|uniref:dTDP-4-dehydrorhamnose 3,5-epimerase family protein n=1 Tax=Streptomyces sp. UNOB3_S3 TaxID=2871682 RepID=UPI001E56C8AE|nr:dTDP-4-dehydrorhamnose 3,5-epimerase family protein [Streptomyces sp. UNOB3_S3]MCC3776678.1 dTDP-4-dehydrorhamnose 3,5-epimerase family protein [Streptomyces sp. UNOB3_S3]